MTVVQHAETATPAERPARRRDWFLIPGIIVLTLFALFLLLEISSRIFFAGAPSTSSVCLVTTDHTTGFRAVPNSVCPDKNAEGPLTEYRFNHQGYRAGVELTPKPTGTYRVVMIGSSFSAGLYIDREKSFAGLLPKELSDGTSRNVQLYNEGINWGTPARVLRNVKDISEAEPDMIFWPLTPWDVENVSGLAPGFSTQSPRVAPPATSAPATSPRDKFATAWHNFSSKFHFVLMLEHFAYLSHSDYQKHYLMLSDAAGYLDNPPDPTWELRLSALDQAIAEMAQHAKEMSVPLVVTELPGRAQLGMIARGEFPPGIDPYLLGNEIRSMVVRHGGIYVDISGELRGRPEMEDDYFPVDGHLNEQGHAAIAQLLAPHLSKIIIAQRHSDFEPVSASARHQQ
jgi:hypothetical protein